jgi:hypothetical protein
VLVYIFCIENSQPHITLSNHSPHGVIRPRRSLVGPVAVSVHFFILTTLHSDYQSHHLPSAWHPHNNQGRLESSKRVQK